MFFFYLYRYAPTTILLNKPRLTNPSMIVALIRDETH